LVDSSFKAQIILWFNCTLSADIYASCSQKSSWCSGLNWIDESVAIGNLIEANDVSLLRKEGIDLVVDVRTAFNANARFEFLLRKQVLNSEKAKKISILLIALFSLKAKVLAHCLEGVDRTP
jgi:hypothetical protein